MNNPGHGSVGKREQDFSELLPLRANGYDPKLLADLSAQMASDPDSVKDGPDPEENLWVPSGYTYLGQFVDHDLTFDSTSSLNPFDVNQPTNLRTPRFDLDCVYGDGPDAQPFMYDEDGAKLLFKNSKEELFPNQAEQDLLRSPNGRAVIGDKRNDENSIVSQIQLTFVKFHNGVVDQLKTQSPDSWNVPKDLFKSARNEVRWAYQKLLVEDFLPRIIQGEVLENLHGLTPEQRDKNYALFTKDKRGNLPREFVVAAYRFGHSGVRTGYRLNGKAGESGGTRLSIFPSSKALNEPPDSLLGFDPLPALHVIDDWRRFFPDTLPNVVPENNIGDVFDEPGNGAVRLQYAYKIDTNLVDPLSVLPRQEIAGESTTQEAIKAIADRTLPDKKDPPRPSLALLNLLRANTYRIQSGQEVAKALRAKGFTKAIDLKPDELCIRKAVEDRKGFFEFVPINTFTPEFESDTPLWFYILAESQAPIVRALNINVQFNEDELNKGIGARTQLGWVGGRIIAEVFYGLIDSDDESYAKKAPLGWKPIWTYDIGCEVIFANLLKFAGQPISPAPTPIQTGA
jgi:hypothetical protein